MIERSRSTGLRIVLICLWVAPLTVPWGCTRADPPSRSQPPTEADRPWFVETAAASGVDFEHRSGHRAPRFLLPESAAGGGALFDMDRDGDLDIYLVQSAEPVEGAAESSGNRLFRNLGSPPSTELRFEDVSAPSGANDRGYGMGVATGDYDGDGDLDLYVTNVGPNVLLRNDCGADGLVSFTDVTAAAGVGEPGFGASAAFVDYDLDGDLDLYVVNYVAWSESVERECRNRLGERDYCDPTEYDAPTPDVLYRNEGPNDRGVVRFLDVSHEAGIDRVSGNGLGVVVADFAGDGRPDLFVSNDRMPDHLWLNRLDPAGQVRFLEEASLAGSALDDDGVPKAGMGVDAVDLDEDRDPDLVVGNFRAESDSLYRNEGSFFVDVTAASGLKTASRPFTRFGLGFHDFDNDGILDLFQATGRVSRQERLFGADPYAEPNLLLRGSRTDSGGLRFDEVLPQGGAAAPAAAGRAAAFGDLDNDGGIDVLVVNRDGPPHLLRNVAADRGGWISFEVLDGNGAPALGAIVELSLGARRITRQVKTAYSYLAASDPRVHIGLGESASARNVSVRWSDGTLETFGDFGAGRIWVLQRGVAQLAWSSFGR